MRFLVTAGNTREKIDAVRQWSNVFTGNTGLAIAKALSSAGDVDLLTSNETHLEEIRRTSPPRISGSGFTNHADLKEKLAAKMRENQYDAIFMTAAVSDYRPLRTYAIVSRENDGTNEKWIVKDVQADKIKSSHGTIAVLGEQTEKLIDLFRREWNHKGLLVKFKLEVSITPDDLLKVGEASRISSGAEYLVANTLDMVEGAKAGAYLLSDKGTEWMPRSELPQRMLRLATEVLHAKDKK